MKRKIINVFLCAAIIFSFSACKKEPGAGGRGSIKGKLYSGNINSPEFEITPECVEPEERVYLVYGDKLDGYDKDTRVSHDGTFEFKHLRKGTYQVFAYGYNPELPSSSGSNPVIKQVEISDARETAEVNDLIVYKRADRGGTSTIRGKLYAMYWSPGQQQLRGQGYVGDEVVYIKFGNSASYDDRIRTSHDGSFEIKNLRMGTYQVWAFSKDPQSPTEETAVLIDIEINERNQVIDIGDLEINK
ncbi:MAG: hypothetical protein H0X62_06690 [Bacteroidetes bacterium]|nr:hypothetical protein [Bacteroidota bacterium]